MIKFIILGDQKVGKSSIRHHFYTKNEMKHSRFLGFDISLDRLFWEDCVDNWQFDISLFLQIWELSTLTRYEQICFSGTHLALVVYDVTVPKTFENLPYWIGKVQQNLENIPLVIIGNKIDLRQKGDKSVTTNMGLQFVKKIEKELDHEEISVFFVETSATTGEIYPANLDISILVENKIVVVPIFSPLTYNIL